MRDRPAAVAARVAAFLAVLAGALGAAASAQAQTASDIPPPVRYLVDENGVDVARGEHLINVTDVSIGPEGPGGLAYTRQLRRNGNANPYDMALFQAGSVWTATTGLRSYTFTLTGTTFTSTDGSGARLVRNGATDTLTTADGTIVTYDYDVVADADVSRRSRATRVKHPSGEELTLYWVMDDICPTNQVGDCPSALVRVVRLQAVQNSLAYQLHFNYDIGGINHPDPVGAWQTLSSVTGINIIHEACPPTNHACALERDWPTAQYLGDSVYDPEGRVSVYTTTASSFAIRRPGSASNDIVYNYGGDGKIDTVVRDGMTWNYGYSVSGNFATLTVTDPGSHVRTIVSDLRIGLPVSVTNELNQTTSYTYHPDGRLQRATAPELNYVEYLYDTRGNVTGTISVPKPGETGTISTSAAYEDCSSPRTCNRPTRITDARGNSTNYTYDPTHGGLLTATAPAGPNNVRPQTRYTYFPYMIGDVTLYRVTRISTCQTQTSCAGTADESVTEIGYSDPNLNPSHVIRRDGTSALSATHAMTHDIVGNLVAVDGPLPNTVDVVQTRYNRAREVTGTISPDPDGGGSLLPRVQRVTRSATSGLVSRVEAGTTTSPNATDWTGFTPLERVDFGYDTAERPVQRALSGPDGVVRALSQINYDNEGRPSCTVVRMNPAELASTQPDACVRDTTGSFGADRITRTHYDAANRPIRVETAVGVAALVADLVRTEYTINGRVANVMDANGNRTTYEYDGYDRLERTLYPDPAAAGTSSPTDDEVLTLDAAGNVVTRTLRDHGTTTPSSIAYEYDALNRLWTKNPSAEGEPTITYNYDNLGRLVSATDGSQPLSFTYDALGRNLTQEGPHGTVASQYDAAGRRITLDYPGNSLIVYYDYLSTGEMTRIRENGATSGIRVLATYGYDALGRRASLVRGNGTSTIYEYDPISRLESLEQRLPNHAAYNLTLGFNYDPGGQIRTNTRSNDLYSYTGHADGSTAYARDGLNRVTQVAGEAVGYDPRHNIALVPASASPSGTATAYTYNSENMLVTGGGITLAYDPLMRLSQASTARWAYDGQEMIAEYNLSNTLLRRFVHGPGVDEPIVWYEGGSVTNRRFLHADERGSIIAVSDATGAVIGTNTYDEYGVPTSPTTGRFQYTGQAWISSLGLYYYRARFYNPRLGRFMQPDPIGYGSGMNLYAYVSNDPVNLVDPTGLSSDDDMPPPKCVGVEQCVTITGTRSPQPRGFMPPQPGVAFGGGGGGGAERMDCNPQLGLCIPEQHITVTVSRRAGSVTAPSLDFYSLFHHWDTGNGRRVCLTSRQFSSVVELGRFRTPPSGNGDALIDFYGTSLENSFGSATLRFRDGRAVGFYDRYDFNRSTHRSGPAELATTVGRLAGAVIGATDFDIVFPCF